MRVGQYLNIVTLYGWRPHIVLEVGRQSVFALERSTLRVRKFPLDVRYHVPANIDYQKVIERLKKAMATPHTTYYNEDVEQAIEAIEEYLHDKQTEAPDSGTSPGADEADSGPGDMESPPISQARPKRKVLAKGKGRRKKARRKKPKRSVRL